MSQGAWQESFFRPGAPNANRVLSMTNWYRELAQFLLDGMHNLVEALLACVLGIDVRESAVDLAAEVAADGGKELLMTKFGKKLTKLSKAVLKVAKKVVPVAAIFNGLVKLGQAIKWFIASGSQHVQDIRDAWNAIPTDNVKLGRESGELVADLIMVLDKDDLVSKKLFGKGAKFNRREDPEECEQELQWKAMQYMDGSAAESSFTYDGIQSIKYKYTSRLQADMVDANTTLAQNLVLLNCSVSITPIDQIEISRSTIDTAANRYHVLRIDIDNASVRVDSHNQDRRVLPHDLMHGSFLVIQHVNGSLVGFSAPRGFSPDTAGLQQRLVSILSFNLGSGRQKECDFRGCHYVETMSVASKNQSVAVVNRMFTGQACSPQPPKNIHSAVASWYPDPRVLDGDAHTVSVVDLKTGVVESIAASSYEHTAFFPTSDNQTNTNATSSTEIHSDQHLVVVATEYTTGNASVHTTTWSSLSQALHEYYLHPINMDALGLTPAHAALAVPHEFITEFVQPSRTEEHHVGPIAGDLVDAIVVEACALTVRPATAVRVLKQLPPSAPVVDQLCRWVHDELAIGQFVDTRERVYNHLARVGIPDAQACLLSIADNGSDDDRERVLNAFVQLSKSPSSDTLEWMKEEMLVSDIASQVLGIFVAHAQMRGDAQLGSDIVQHCVDARDNATDDGDHEATVVHNLMCLRHASHPAAAAAILDTLDHPNREVQQSAVMALETYEYRLLSAILSFIYLGNAGFVHRNQKGTT